MAGKFATEWAEKLVVLAVSGNLSEEPHLLHLNLGGELVGAVPIDSTSAGATEARRMCAALARELDAFAEAVAKAAPPTDRAPPPVFAEREMLTPDEFVARQHPTAGRFTGEF